MNVPIAIQVKGVVIPRPKPIHSPVHGAPGAGLTARDMIRDHVVLKAPCAPFDVSPATAADLSPSGIVQGGCAMGAFQRVAIPAQSSLRLALTLLATAGLRRANEAGRAVRDTTAGGILLMVLAARPGRAVVPFKPEVLRVSPAIRRTIVGRQPADGEDGDRDCRGLNPGALVCGRHTLNAMPASLMVERCRTRAADGQDDGLIAGARVRRGISAILSIAARCQTPIGDGQLGNEQAGISAAFGRAKFENAMRHGDDPLVQREGRPYGRARSPSASTMVERIPDYRSMLLSGTVRPDQ